MTGEIGREVVQRYLDQCAREAVHIGTPEFRQRVADAYRAAAVLVAVPVSPVPAQPPRSCAACRNAAGYGADQYHPDSDVGPWDAACPDCGHICGTANIADGTCSRCAPVPAQEEREPSDIAAIRAALDEYADLIPAPFTDSGQRNFGVTIAGHARSVGCLVAARLALARLASVPSLGAPGGTTGERDLTQALIRWWSDDPSLGHVPYRRMASDAAEIAARLSSSRSREGERDWTPDVCAKCGRVDWQSARDLLYTYCGHCGARAGGSREGEPSGPLADFARVCVSGFDHDNDAHRYNTFCRVCEAEKALRASRSREGEPSGPLEPPSFDPGDLTGDDLLYYEARAGGYLDGWRDALRASRSREGEPSGPLDEAISALESIAHGQKGDRADYVGTISGQHATALLKALRASRSRGAGASEERET